MNILHQKLPALVLRRIRPTAFLRLNLPSYCDWDIRIHRLELLESVILSEGNKLDILCHSRIGQTGKRQLFGEICPISKIAMENHVLIRRCLIEEGFEIMSCWREFNYRNQVS